MKDLQLERNGRNWKGICPWCSKRTLHLNRERDRYHCFGCGKAGAASQLAGKMRRLALSRSWGIAEDELKELDDYLENRYGL